MRNRFPFFKLNPNITYLDSAATSQTLDSVVEDSTNFLLNHKANAHQCSANDSAEGCSATAWHCQQFSVPLQQNPTVPDA